MRRRGRLPAGERLPYNAVFMSQQTARPRASLHTLGCRLNQAETAVIGDVLSRHGYDIVPFGEATDLLVLNTCSVTENAERDCRYAVRRTLRHSPEAFIAVIGCYAQTGHEELRRMPGIDLLLGNQYKLELPQYLPAGRRLRKLPLMDVHHTRTIDRRDFALPGTAYSDSTRALLKIQDGCDFMCSFCIIPFARGHERSRILDDVIREADSLAARGYKELVLTGVNIGRYRYREFGFVELLQRLESVPGIERIRISSIEPTTVTRELLDYMAVSEKVCRYLHLPLQSGDDRVLGAMNRKYTVRHYSELVETACRLLPDLGLGTDLMVGFPGEGDQEFDNTVRVARDLPFSYFHVFSYSRRPGTAAARMKESVPSSTIRQRSRTLADLSRAKHGAYARRYIGRTLRVLFEQGQRDGFSFGLTDNFLRVAVPALEQDPAGTIQDVTITGIAGGLVVG
ncbi:MAG TPA: tRNA (N(6)-L-threonylcarbamoyladenosine(37)-C(2))-methylthiotransferase MtaB, partial [Nitrospiraceae bacterium]|nr:tRNA (N(6)-L-threonylcarbamoyladenosine(37)-C(2))-methylthiotransferase MtaB [Nitrospiraceae bacterium]